MTEGTIVVGPKGWLPEDCIFVGLGPKWVQLSRYAIGDYRPIGLPLLRTTQMAHYDPSGPRNRGVCVKIQQFMQELLDMTKEEWEWFHLQEVLKND